MSCHCIWFNWLLWNSVGSFARLDIKSKLHSGSSGKCLSFATRYWAWAKETATKDQKSKCDRKGQRKQRLYKDQKNEAKAQRDGDIYAHGSAFTLTLDINTIPTESTIPVLQQMSCKKRAISKTSLQGYSGLAIDSTTGFPINPGTGRIIDGSEPYCKACLNFGHSQQSFQGCGKYKSTKASIADEKNNTNDELMESENK